MSRYIYSWLIFQNNYKINRYYVSKIFLHEYWNSQYNITLSLMENKSFFKGLLFNTLIISVHVIFLSLKFLPWASLYRRGKQIEKSINYTYIKAISLFWIFRSYFCTCENCNLFVGHIKDIFLIVYEFLTRLIWYEREREREKERRRDAKNWTLAVGIAANLSMIASFEGQAMLAQWVYYF